MSKSKRLLSLALALLMIMGVLPVLSIGVLAADGTVAAMLYDNSNGWVDFGGANDSAAIGYSSGAERDYSMKVILTFPSDATAKTATITLAEGLKFQNDGSAQLQTSWLDGPVVNAPNAAPLGLTADMTNTGSKTYLFLDTVGSVTIELTIRADSRFWYDTITHAITAAMSYTGGASSEVVLETLAVQNTNRTLHTGNGNYEGHVSTNAPDIISNNDRLFFSSLSADWSACPIFYEAFAATFTIDANVVVTNTDLANWTMTSEPSGAQTKYTFQYKNGAPGLLDTLITPVAFEFPSASPAGFKAGDKITGSRSATAKLVGGRVVTWPSRSLTFNIVKEGVDLFVNYDTMSTAIVSSGTGAVSTSHSGSISPTLSGVLGWYTIGNRGGEASGPQTVELSFDEEKLGVLGIALAIPAGQVVSGIAYKTAGNTSWQSWAGTITGPSGQYDYRSWKDLGIQENPMDTGSYITAIRYTLSGIPAASIIGMRENNTYRNSIYGVTLPGGVGETALSTVSLYSPGDANDTDKWIKGTICSDHSKRYVSLGFKNIAGSVTITAGETLSFSQTITARPENWVSNAQRNNAVEHPTIYLRSESGNPITNIRIVNSRGTELTSYLDITSGQAEGAMVYKIDTTRVPGDGAAIAHSAVRSNGESRTFEFTLSYDIDTKLTDSGTFYYADMLFVQTPVPDFDPTTFTHAQRQDGVLANGIGTGDGRVWWMPASVTAGYTIIGRTDITVDLAAKGDGEAAGSYTTWTEGADPIAIGTGGGSAIDIRLDVVNNSGVVINNPTIIYLPIPKMGDDWGSLIYNSGAFEFSMRLKRAFSLPLGIDGSITYGTVTPTDSGPALNGYSFEPWSPSGAAGYNCVKITLDALSSSSDPVSMTLQMMVDPATPGLSEGMVNIWRPCYYENFTKANGDPFTMWEKGAYLATTTAVDEIQVWTVKLDGNGGYFDGPGGVTEKNVDAGEGDLFGGLPVPQRPGYEFAGWQDSAGNPKEPHEEITGDIELAAQWTAKTYTVTFVYNGADSGSGTADGPVTYGAAYGALPVPTRTGYTFGGWYLEAGFTHKVEAATVVAVAGDHALYAKWTAQNHYTVSGTVTADDDPVGTLGDVLVYLTQGGHRAAQDITGGDGRFSFDDIPPGRYNLVAEHTDPTDPHNPVVTVVTQILCIPDDLYAGDITILMPLAQGHKNSVFIHDGSVQVDAVGGLHDVYDAAKDHGNTDERMGITEDDLDILDAGGEIILYFEAKETNPTQSEQINAVQGEAQEHSKVVGYELDLSAYKTVTRSDGSLKAEHQPLDALNDVVSIYIPLPDALQGREGYIVYRNHGAQVEAIGSTTRPEYFEISPDGKTMILHVMKFSVYAIAVDPIISFNSNSGTGTMADVHVNGGSCALPACLFTREGYRFVGWNSQADGSGSPYADNAMLSGITGDIALYAQWTANNGTPPSSPDEGAGAGGGGAGSRLILMPSINGKVSVGDTHPSPGALVTVTAKPDAGYRLDALSITDGRGNDIPYTDGGGTYTFTMPGDTATVSVTFKEISPVDSDSDVSRLLNTDDHVAYITGRPDHVFGAQDNMTRAETAQMFYNLLRDQKVVSNAAFLDVQEGAWYAAAVNTLAALGILEGFPDGCFYPDHPVTRAQFAALAVRFARVSPVDARFNDVPPTHWAYHAVNTAAHFNWVEGVGQDMFAPNRNITRAEAVTWVNRMLRRYPDKARIDSSTNLIRFSDPVRDSWAYYEIMEAANTHDYIWDGHEEIWK